MAALLREHGVNRISLGAQTFQPRLLEMLERRASPATVRAAFHTLREAGFDNLSLDLVYGIPGQSRADLAADLAAALALAPEHLSCYELEAKPGTRFTHAHGDELAAQAEAMEGVLRARRRDAHRPPATAGTRPPTSAAPTTAATCARGTTSATGAAATTSAWASAPSPRSAGLRWRNAPSLPRYLAAARARRASPRASSSRSTTTTRARERVLLGLRLDEPLTTAGLDDAIDGAALDRLERLGLVRGSIDAGALALTAARPLPRRRRHCRACSRKIPANG